MPSISSEQPPEGTEIRLTEYLSRMFVQMNIALDQTKDFDVLYVVPDKLRIGKLYYFGAAVLPDISGEGIWIYKSTGWVLLG